MPDASPPRTVQRLFAACSGADAAALVHAAHAAGLEVVAPFDADTADAPWVEDADWDAPLIARSPDDDPWADAQRLVSAALDAGADALHPGAGGSPTLARLAIASGLGWMGAAPELLEDWEGAVARAAEATGVAAHAEGMAAPVEVGVLADAAAVVVLGARRSRGAGLVEVEACPEPMARAAADLAAALSLRGLASFTFAGTPSGRVVLTRALPWLPAWPDFDAALDADLFGAQLQLLLAEAPGWPARPAVRPTVAAVLTADTDQDEVPELPSPATSLAGLAGVRAGAPIGVLRRSADTLADARAALLDALHDLPTDLTADLRALLAPEPG